MNVFPNFTRTPLIMHKPDFIDDVPQFPFQVYSPGAKLENGGLPYTESPLSFDGFN